MKSLTLNEEQLECLASPLRQEIATILLTNGPMSAANLAKDLSVLDKSVYYPLRKLLSCGLVREVCRVRATRRSEALYDVVADRLDLPGGQAPNFDAVKATLRLAEREFLAASRSDIDKEALRVYRASLRLSPENLARYYEMLETAIAFAKANEDKTTRTVTFTAVCAPRANSARHRRGRKHRSD